MKKRHTKSIGLAALLSLGTFAYASPVQQEVFTFSGNCTVDCSGIATGTLTLQDYAQGTPLDSSNFVSFQYHSSLYTFNVTSISGLFGNIPVSLPSGASVGIEATDFNQFFSSGSGGSWCLGNQCADAGNSGVWDAATSAPEPSVGVLVLLGCGLIGIRRLTGRIKRNKT